MIETKEYGFCGHNRYTSVMKKNVSFVRLIVIFGILIAMLPLIVILCILFYSQYLKTTPVYGSHHQHTPYPQLLIKDSSQRQLIQKGAYLAKIGNCISCHTDTKQKRPAFSGGLLLDTPYGKIYSTNITPDKDTGIGQWREIDFINAMTKGVSPSGQHYFPAFPYPYFSLMTKNDLHALFLYLKAIPPIKQENRSNHLPYALPFARRSMLIWNYFYFPIKVKSNNPAHQSENHTRGNYLVNGLGHCGMCHTPLNLFGAPEMKYHLVGRFVGGYWAPNITKSGLQHTNTAELLKTFNDNRLLNNAGPLAGPMTEVTLNSLQYLTREDQRSIASYLTALKSKSHLSVNTDTHPPSMKRGKYIYKRVCVICHQDGNMGAPRIGNGSGWLSRLNRHGLITLYERTLNGFNSMPAFGACVNCSDSDIKAAVDYIIYQSIPYSKWRRIKKTLKS